MIRQIVRIDDGKCTGCGLCALACHERAIGIVEGKARLLRDDYCDGLGACLPICPAGAIAFEQREAAAYDETAVKASSEDERHLACCPGTHAKAIEREAAYAAKSGTYLRQWPVQIKLAPINAAYFADADLLIAADCAAYAYGNFHGEYMKDRITLIGCPKLDEGDYCEKLTALLQANDIKSVMVARMEVPCCGGIENAVRTALKNSGKFIPCQAVTIAI